MTSSRQFRLAMAGAGSKRKRPRNLRRGDYHRASRGSSEDEMRCGAVSAAYQGWR